MIECANCGATIDKEKLRKRSHHSELSFCNRDCLVEYRTRTGFYKEMSAQGKEKRSEAVARSNSNNPRRRKQ